MSTTLKGKDKTKTTGSSFSGFSLGGSSSSKKKKKSKHGSNNNNNKKNPTPPLSEFGHTTTPTDHSSSFSSSRSFRNEPLVIPLTNAQKGSLLERRRNELKQKEDQSTDELAAAAALSNSASRHFSGKDEHDGVSTNFSSSGNLIIAADKNTNLAKASASGATRDEESFRKDMEVLPDDQGVDSNVYEKVPIHEFGAAMLRGMGWSGSNKNDKDGKNSKDKTPSMRPHRLGLGATPRLLEPPSSSSSGRPRTMNQVKRDERLAAQQKEFEAMRQKQVAQDKQRTVQVGSIIWVGQERRAVMVKTAGVPGLNRVLVRFEGDTDSTSVRKGDVSLVSREDLDAKPFREEEPPKKPKNDKGRQRRQRDHDDDDDKRRKDDRRQDKREKRKRRSRDSDYDDDYTDSDNDRRGPSSSSKKKKKTKRSKDSRHDDSGKDEPEHPNHWLIPNIRVRIVSKKLGSQHFKAKGVVIDVTRGPTATLEMPGKQVLDRVPERYLETALPKAGGNVVVLLGPSRMAKGKLLERNSNSGKGVVQVFEDMSILTLSLDDMAEWVGPLDDDLME